jgi:hypothetical protein
MRTHSTPVDIRRCPACNLGILSDDGDGEYCAHCLFTTDPRMTLDAAVARAEAVALAESRALREQYTRQRAAPTPRRRAA